MILCLIDAYIMGQSPFSTAGKSGKTFTRTILSRTTREVFFDIRHDSDALLALFGIAPQGVKDIRPRENTSLLANISAKRRIGRRA